MHVFSAFRLCECSSYMSGILMLVVLNEAQCLSSGSPLVLISFYQPFSGAIHWAAELTFDPKCIKDFLLGAAVSSPSRHFNWKHIVLLSIHHLPRSRECREDMTIPLLCRIIRVIPFLMAPPHRDPKQTSKQDGTSYSLSVIVEIPGSRFRILT